MIHRIKLDGTPHSVVVTCSCGWRDVTTTRASGHIIAAAHELRAHPGQHVADDARRRYECQRTKSSEAG